MSTKAGVHVTTGARNGYGKVAAAVPAAVLTDHDAGALAEAKQYGGERVITIYRDLSFYRNNDGPDGIGSMTEAEARAEAEARWPEMLASCRKHPADYYQLTNEIGGGQEGPTRALIAYETRLMALAEAEGLHLFVANQAGATPGDFEVWKRLFVPFLRRAEQGGHVYSRHAYGGVHPGSSGLLTTPDGQPADDNTGRPFREARYLKEQGIQTPMVITETGQHAGYDFAGVETFVEDVRRYDALCRAHDNIWAFCLWTYGDWDNANIAPASDALAAYLREQGGAERQQYPAATIAETRGPETAMPETVAPQTNGTTPATPGREIRRVNAEAGLNLRREPLLDAPIIRTLPFGEQVEIIEDGPWAHVRVAGDVGYVYTAYLAPVEAPVTTPAPTPVPTPEPQRERSVGEVRFGMNINPDAVHANPVDSGALRGMNWVRFPFKLSARPNEAERGNLEAAFAQYDPLVRRYAEQGINTLLILNQETVAGDVPWEFQMGNGSVHEYSDARGEWEAYAARFADVAGRIAAHYRDLGLGKQIAFQIWNEGDLRGNHASIYLKPQHMAIILDRAAKAIHRELPDVPLVFNGMATGAGEAVTYLKECRRALGGRLPVSAIGIHPYGSYVSGPPFEGWGFGRLADGLAHFRQQLPGMRFWITEIGIAEDTELGPEHYPAIANYMREICTHVAGEHGDVIDALIWFAWSDEMRNAGMVNRQGRPKEHIYPVFEQVRDRTLF